MQKRFTINSTETTYEKVHHSCTFEKPILKSGDHPKILASINPPIPMHFYGRLESDLDMIVLAPRLQGCTVYPNISEPCYAYMCIPKEGGDWSDGPWEILDWVEIKLTHSWGGNKKLESEAS